LAAVGGNGGAEDSAAEAGEDQEPVGALLMG
jgi:hypothetical protein